MAALSRRKNGWAAVADKKVSTTVYITRDQAERLKILHARTKVPVAEYIRQGIDWVLAQNEDKLPGQMSLGISSDDGQ